jgi:hypothetical protein
MSEKSLAFLAQSASLHLQCSNVHVATWQSAREGTFTMVPPLNDRAIHAGLCCGCGYTGYKEWATEFGLPEPAEKAWYSFQQGSKGRISWCDAVLAVSQERMTAVRVEIIARDGEEGTVVFLDAKFDSSRDGYHGTVPVLDMLSET